MADLTADEITQPLIALRNRLHALYSGTFLPEWDVRRAAPKNLADVVLVALMQLRVINVGSTAAPRWLAENLSVGGATDEALGLFARSVKMMLVLDFQSRSRTCWQASLKLWAIRTFAN